MFFTQVVVLLFVMLCGDMVGYHLFKRTSLPLSSPSVASLFQVLNKMTDFHEILYEHNTIGGHSNFAFFNLLQLLTSAWWMQKFVRWEQH